MFVCVGSPGSHLGMYKAVTDAILKAVNEASPCCAFLCWGNYAKAACNMLRQYPNANARHLYLDAYHPIAWHMYQHAHSGALHMQAANYWLVQHNYPPVNWMAASM